MNKNTKFPSQQELASIVKTLRHNVDEAEQFNDFIDQLIEHCDSRCLVDIMYNLVDAVKFNLETKSSFKENIQTDREELDEILKEADRILDISYLCPRTRKENKC